ncbi:MAG: DUF4357 domain-containing protein [Rhodobacteraceae bacterium]|nr:DUF4357 domain-containing protein [Paracoccaceae bacterium]
MLVRILGWDIFQDEEISNRAPEQERPKADSHKRPRFFSVDTDFDAKMEIGSLGEFVVLAGSKVRRQVSTKAPKYTVKRRKTLIKGGILREDGNFLVFTSPCSFRSASGAAGIVTGTSANGRTFWKLEDGTTYNDWQASQGTADGNLGDTAG